MAYIALSLTSGMYHVHVCIQQASRLTSDQDASAFIAVIRFSHPWGHDEFKTIVHRAICQDYYVFLACVVHSDFRNGGRQFQSSGKF